MLLAPQSFAPSSHFPTKELDDFFDSPDSNGFDTFDSISSHSYSYSIRLDSTPAFRSSLVYRLFRCSHITHRFSTDPLRTGTSNHTIVTRLPTLLTHEEFKTCSDHFSCLATIEAHRGPQLLPLNPDPSTQLTNHLNSHRSIHAHPPLGSRAIRYRPPCLTA